MLLIEFGVLYFFVLLLLLLAERRHYALGAVAGLLVILTGLFTAQYGIDFEVGKNTTISGTSLAVGNSTAFILGTQNSTTTTNQITNTTSISYSSGFLNQTQNGTTLQKINLSKSEITKPILEQSSALNTVCALLQVLLGLYLTIAYGNRAVRAW